MFASRNLAFGSMEHVGNNGRLEHSIVPQCQAVSSCTRDWWRSAAFFALKSRMLRTTHSAAAACLNLSSALRLIPDRRPTRRVGRERWAGLIQ
jgi:hypothetical protein